MNEFFNQLVDSILENSDLSLEKEQLHFEKNGVKSTINVFFNKQGYPINVTIETQRIRSKEELLNEANVLQKKIEDAVEHEDFNIAAKLKAQRDKIMNQLNH